MKQWNDTMRSVTNRLRLRKVKTTDLLSFEDESMNWQEDSIKSPIQPDLSFKVSHATDLPSMDVNGYSDPFCFIIVGERKWKTSIKKKNLNPVWNETFMIPGKELNKTNGELIIEVYDKDEWTTDDFIGMIQINVYEEVEDHGEKHMTAKLKEHSPRKRLTSSRRGSVARNLGELTFMMSWTAPSLGSKSPIHFQERNEHKVEGEHMKIKESNVIPVPGMPTSLPSITHSSRGSIFEEPAVATLILSISEVELNMSLADAVNIFCPKKCFIQCTKERAKKRVNKVLGNLAHGRNWFHVKTPMRYYSSHKSSDSRTSTWTRSLSDESHFFKTFLPEETSSSDEEASSVGDATDQGEEHEATLTRSDLMSESEWFYKVKFHLNRQTRISDSVHYYCDGGQRMSFPGYACFVVQLPLPNVEVQISMCRKCPTSRRVLPIPFTCSLYDILNADESCFISSDYGSMEIRYKLIPLDKRPHVLNLKQVQEQPVSSTSVDWSPTSPPSSPTPSLLRKSSYLNTSGIVEAENPLIGSFEIFLDSIELTNVKSLVQFCFCVLKCGQHWALTAPQQVDSTMYWKWIMKFPIYEPATVVSLTVFGDGGIVRQYTRIGKLRVRLSTLEPGKQTDCRLALVADGVEVGNAKLTLKLEYPSDFGLLKEYLKSEFQDDIYNYKLNSGSAKSLIRKERRKIIIQWLDSSLPRIPLHVSRKVLDLERESFDRKRMAVHIRRIQHCFAFVPAMSKKFSSLKAWENPIETIGVLIGIWIAVYNLTSVIVLGLFLGFTTLSITYSAYATPPSMNDPILIPPSETPHGQEEKTSDGTLGLKSRIDQFQSILVRVQKILDTIASFLERIHALLTWRDPVATRALTIVLLLGAIALSILGLQVCIAFGLCWVLRPPFLQNPFPSPPLNFFKRLPSRSDQIL